MQEKCLVIFKNKKLTKNVVENHHRNLRNEDFNCINCINIISNKVTNNLWEASHKNKS